MVQQAASAEVSPEPAKVFFAGTPEELGRGWVVLKDCRLGPPRPGGDRPAVLLHPARGVAVLDISPSETPGAVEAVGAKLEAACFRATFEGCLPVVHLQVTQEEMLLLPLLLEETFAEQPPLYIPAGDAWVGAAARALAAEPPPAPRPEPARLDAPDRAKRRRRPRRAAATLRKAGAVLLCLAALGGVLGAVLNTLPALAPSASVPGAAAAAPPAGGAFASRALAAHPQPAPDPVPPSLPARTGSDAAVAVSAPGTPSPVTAQPTPVARPSLLDEARPPPPLPQRAVAPSRRPEPAAAPAAAPAPMLAPGPVREPPPERPALQRARGAAGAGASAEAASADRCRRVSSLVELGASLADADMRFFNEACARW